ncbi:unannotated protein [freshwater metagenome]|uniref:Unannotated protein n=1 Tax=freshwater metagenome TaxID=449393 RepID=A0A6J6HWH0_9ZZZZ
MAGIPSGTTRCLLALPITFKVLRELSMSDKFKPHNSETRIPEPYKTSSMARSLIFSALGSSAAFTSRDLITVAASLTFNTSGKTL